MSEFFYETLTKMGHTSVFDIVAQGREAFLAKSARLYQLDDAGQFYDDALSRASMITRRYMEALGQPPGGGPVTVKALAEQPTWEDLFPQDMSALCPADSLESNDSPAAYLNQLYRLALALDKQQKNALLKLKKRRPDLPELSVDAKSWKIELPTQQLVKEILENSFARSRGVDTLALPETLSKARYPMDLPYDPPTDTIQRSLAVSDNDLGTVLLQSHEEPAFLLDANENTDIRHAQHAALNVAPALRQLCGEDAVFNAGTITPKTLPGAPLIGPDITCLLPWQVDNADIYRCGFVTVPTGETDAVLAEPDASALIVSTTTGVYTRLKVPCKRLSGTGPMRLYAELAACTFQPGGTGTDDAPQDIQLHINNAVAGKRKPAQRYLKVWFLGIKKYDKPEENYTLKSDETYAGTLHLQAKSYADQHIMGEFYYGIQLQDHANDISVPEAHNYCMTHYGQPLLSTTRNDVNVELPLNDVLKSCKLSRAELENLLCQSEQAPRLSPNCQPTNKMFALKRAGHAFPAPYHYGAVYLHGGAAPLLRIEDPEDKLSLLCGSAMIIERLHRFIRLQKALDLGHEALDHLLVAASKANRNNHGCGMILDDNIFRALGLFQQWRRTRKVDAFTFAAILHQISPFSLGTAESQLDALFNRDCPEKDRLILDWQPQDDDFSADKPLHPWSKRLCAGLRIDENAYRLLAPKVLEHLPLPEITTSRRLYRTLETLSAFWRPVTVFRLLGVSPLEGAAMVNLLDNPESVWQQLVGQPTLSVDGKSNDILDCLVRLEAIASWLRSQEIQPSAACLLLKRSEMTVIPTDPLLQWLKDINEKITPERVTSSRLQALSLPEKDDNDKKIDWSTVLQPLVDEQGLLQSAIEEEAQLPDMLTSVLKTLNLKNTHSIHQQLLTFLTDSLRAQRSIAQTAITTHYQVSAQLPALLLRWMGSHENALLTLARQDELTQQDLQWLYDLNAYSAVANHLSLSPAVIDSLINHAPYWEGKAVAGEKDKPVGLDVKNFHRLCAFAELRDSVGNGEALALQWLRDANLPGEDSQLNLQELLGLNASDSGWAIKNPPRNMGQLATLRRKQTACKDLALSLSAFSEITEKLTRDENFTTRQQMADTLLNAVRAKDQE